jgi:DNA-binding response OmpR family regulator
MYSPVEQTTMINAKPTTNSLLANGSPENSAQVLVVEDDEALRRLLQMTLKRDGYQVITAENGKEALELFATHPVDIVLLDVNMPVMNGYAVCMELRKQTHVPIMFITAKSRMDDLVTGIELGADNYVTKPFTIQELRARIRAMLQRVKQNSKNTPDYIITVGDICLNEKTLQVTARGESISLTPNEFRLLNHLMRNPDKLITKDEFLANVWDYEPCDDVNFMRVTVRRLRSKIEEDPSKPRYLKTVHGMGYQFCSSETASMSKPN